MPKGGDHVKRVPANVHDLAFGALDGFAQRGIRHVGGNQPRGRGLEDVAIFVAGRCIDCVFESRNEAVGVYSEEGSVGGFVVVTVNNGKQK